jgi:tetratricopeptide (TPR) repeat protein
LEQQKRLYRPEFPLELWWHKSLEGEIALASGDPQRAFAVLSEGLPNGKYFCFDSAGAVLLVNHLPVRDALARAAKARGDLPAAIEAYRQLLTPGAESVWVSMLEPRNVLELARLLEKTGDRTGALKEYERFLELWKRADPGLPELAEARRAVARLHG